MDHRYQHQPWYVKLWRRRWYLLIPFSALMSWIHCRKNDPEDPYTFRSCWDIAIGLTQMKMDWYYTWEEVFPDWGEDE